ncbi:MAG: serine hydrolase domain-containing protein [Gemmatimonadaceae bacterium]
MRLINIHLGLLLGLTASVAIAQDSRAGGTVDSLFSPFNENIRPGLAVAVVRDGRLVFANGYGMANLEHRVRITPATVFDVASVSKQFAGLAIAMLVEQGKIRLSDDVRRYIPELGDVGYTITIDHLVHHTSGLRDWPGSLSLAGWRMDDVIAFDQILRFAYHQRSLNFKPGDEYTYSNTGYNLLAEVVARVTGRSFRQFTQEQLFRPLGMTRSRFHDDVTELIPDRAFGYAKSDSGWKSITDNLAALGSSSLFTTVEDLAKWVANFDDPKVGGAAAMTRTRTRGQLNDGSTIPYAFGVSHGEYRGQPTVAHSGSWAEFATYVLHFPREHAGVIVLANSGSINASSAAYQVADAFLGSAFGARAEDTLATAPAITAPAAMLDRYAGLYRLGPGWYLRIRHEGNALTTQATREPAFPMSARSDTSFWVDGYRAMMAFTNVKVGPITLIYRNRPYPRLIERGSAPPSDLSAYGGEYESEELGTKYRIEVKDAGLVMQHYRHGTIPLTWLWKEDFGGSAWFTRSVEFERDASGRVIGFSVFVDERSRHIRFSKLLR